jgi:hypothetical protein
MTPFAGVIKTLAIGLSMHLSFENGSALVAELYGAQEFVSIPWSRFKKVLIEM